MGTVRSVVVGGSLAQRPFYGGHSWVLLQYLLGFRDLGWDVLFLDRLEPEMTVEGPEVPVEKSVNWRYLATTMHDCGLEGSYAVGTDSNRRWLGLEEPEVIKRVRDADLMINVMGFIDHPAVLAAASPLVFLDIDPGFGQMWKELGLADIFGSHDAYLTVGGNVGSAGCSVPTAGLDWIPTRPPVVLSRWPVVSGGQGDFTAIGSWRGPFGPMEYEGRSFGLRVHEFRKFFSLPGRAGLEFRAAMDIDPAEESDLEQLQANGWLLEDPIQAARDPWSYRRYIQGSTAEFLVAKGMYVVTSSGWVSDRSVCFLASGKPVLAQDTGLAGTYPTGGGLVTFSDLEEAAEGAARISRDYSFHSRRARELAEDHFDSRKVLPQLVDLVGAL